MMLTIQQRPVAVVRNPIAPHTVSARGRRNGGAGTRTTPRRSTGCLWRWSEATAGKSVAVVGVAPQIVTGTSQAGTLPNSLDTGQFISSLQSSPLAWPAGLARPSAAMIASSRRSLLCLALAKWPTQFLRLVK